LNRTDSDYVLETHFISKPETVVTSNSSSLTANNRNEEHGKAYTKGATEARARVNNLTASFTTRQLKMPDHGIY
jgi:hypothetical protein